MSAKGGVRRADYNGDWPKVMTRKLLNSSTKPRLRLFLKRMGVIADESVEKEVLVEAAFCVVRAHLKDNGDFIRPGIPQRKSMMAEARKGRGYESD